MTLVKFPLPIPWFLLSDFLAKLAFLGKRQGVTSFAPEERFQSLEIVLPYSFIRQMGNLKPKEGRTHSSPGV